MARTLAKLTIKRGAGVEMNRVAVSAGAVEAQSDTISVNIDATNLTKGDAIILMEGVLQKLQKSNWPLV